MAKFVLLRGPVGCKKTTREIVLQTMSDSGRLMQLPRKANMGGDEEERMPQGKL